MKTEKSTIKDNICIKQLQNFLKSYLVQVYIKI